MAGFASLAQGKTTIKLYSKVPEQVHSKEKCKEVPSTNCVAKDIKSLDVVLRYRPPEDTDIKPIVETQVADSAGPSKHGHKKKKKHKEHRKEHNEDKDKERKKKKHKDKHRKKDHEKETHGVDNPPRIKITIPKSPLRIPKDKLFKPHLKQGKTQNSLKIEVSKDVKHSHLSSKSSIFWSGSSEKRERSSHQDEDRHPSKRTKIDKTNGDYRMAK